MPKILMGFLPASEGALLVDWHEVRATGAAVYRRRISGGCRTTGSSPARSPQKQRVILARALYRRPQILVLDEATSHLDEPTEAMIAAALRGLDMTRIIVAHRPATIAHADQVLSFGALAQEPALPVA